MKKLIALKIKNLLLNSDKNFQKINKLLITQPLVLIEKIYKAFHNINQNIFLKSFSNRFI